MEDGRQAINTPPIPRRVDSVRHGRQVDPRTVAGPRPGDLEAIETASRDELAALANDLSFPRIIKPVDGVGGRGITCAENAEELLAAYDKLMKRETTQPLLQEVVDGEDYCLTVLYHEGELVAHSAYTNIANMPVEGGSGAVRETVDDGKFMEVAEKLFGPLGWSGVAEIDFRWDGDPDSDAYLIEVNPRFWAGLFQSVESGVDFPWLLYQLYTSGQVDAEPVAKIGTKTKVPAIWLAAAIRDSFDDALHLDESRKMLAIAGRHFRRGHFLRGHLLHGVRGVGPLR